MALSSINTSNLPRKRRLRPGETPLSPVDVSELPERREPGGNFLSSVGDALQAGSASGAPGGANASELSAPDPVNVSQFPDRKQQFEEGPSGFQEIVGGLGDAISVGAGADPVFRQGQQQRKLRNALTAFQNNPEQGLAEVMQVSPEVGLQLQQQQTRRQQVEGVNQQREFERGRAAQLSAVRALKSARDSGADMGQAFDRLAPAIQNMGVDQQQLQQLRQTVIDNPQALDALEQGLLDPSTVNQQQDLDQTQRHMMSLIQQGVPPQRAQNIAHGTEQVVTDPDTGLPFALNVATGERRPLHGMGGGQQAGAQPGQEGQQGQAADQTGGAGASQRLSVGGQGAQQTGRTLWNATEGVAGFPGLVQELWGRFGGQIFEIGEGTEETLQNRQAFRVATNDLVRSLSINPRFPVGEMERIREEVNIQPNVFDSQQALKTRMKQLDSFLSQRQQREEEASQNPDLPSDTRQAAAQAAKDVRNFRELLGVPERGGATVQRIQNMSLNELTNLDPSQLNDAQLEAASQRFNEVGGQ